MAIQPKPFSQAYNPEGNKKKYFSSEYSLNKKAGVNGTLAIGQDIYCIPLLQRGLFSIPVHTVKTKGFNEGFKRNKFNSIIMCHRGEEGSECEACRLASEGYEKYIASGKTVNSLITFASKRFYLPVLLLGYDAPNKNTLGVPLTKLTMAGRDFAFIEFANKTFDEVITNLKNTLLNNGSVSYDLEPDQLYEAVCAHMARNILKINIAKPSAANFGTHTKVFSFIPFENTMIGSETGSYSNIVNYGLDQTIASEVNEFLDKFTDELDQVLTPWTPAELSDYVNSVATPQQYAQAQAQQYAVAGTVPATNTVIPKNEQIVLENTPIINANEQINLTDDSDDGMFDGQQPVYTQQVVQPIQQPVYQQPMAQPVPPVQQMPPVQPVVQPAQPVYQQPVYTQQPVQQPVYQQPVVQQVPPVQPVQQPVYQQTPQQIPPMVQQQVPVGVPVGATVGATVVDEYDSSLSFGDEEDFFGAE